MLLLLSKSSVSPRSSVRRPGQSHSCKEGCSIMCTDVPTWPKHIRCRCLDLSAMTNKQACRQKALKDKELKNSICSIPRGWYSGDSNLKYCAIYPR